MLFGLALAPVFFCWGDVSRPCNDQWRWGPIFRRTVCSGGHTLSSLRPHGTTYPNEINSFCRWKQRSIGCHLCFAAEKYDYWAIGRDLLAICNIKFQHSFFGMKACLDSFESLKTTACMCIVQKMKRVLFWCTSPQAEAKVCFKNFTLVGILG